VSVRAGFTLVETLISLVLSSVLIILVSTTFLVQNQYYASQTLRAATHDNARVATERMATEVRSVMEDGFVVAGPRTLTIRSPMLLGAVCNRNGTNFDVHNEGGEVGISTNSSEVAGVGWLNISSGDWSYRTTTWSFVNGSGGTPAASCAGNGADTAWAASQFHRMRRFFLLYGSTPDEGDVIMVYRETTFKIQDSVLEPGTLGLYRGSYAQPLVEFATGMDATAQFQNRTGGSTYADTITSGSLDDIDAVRLVADARKRATTGGQDDVTFGWSVNIILRNIP
jgi:prepilin-type N-terminal cleavage/methylation domain-containing protein